MPSTYSPNLRIELIATGEQANTWGATTNTNLGTLLEQAISGIATVNVTSGDVTLTAANGASDEARCMILKVTGSPGVSRNVLTPASVTKAYIVHNTSNAAVVIKTAAAGTNATVTVQAGGKQGVYTDGTNVYDITSATSTEISYLTGVTSAIQTQINTTNTTISNLTNTLQSNLYAPAGTAMAFQQTSAPTGWTKATTHNDKALRVVSGSVGSGGSLSFTTAFASRGISGTVASHTLTVAQIPSHTHGYDTIVDLVTSQYGYLKGTAFNTAVLSGTSTGAAGSSQGHDHGFTGTNLDMTVQYVDVIIATKN